MDETSGHGRIIVINPNSNQTVTDGISAALAPLRFIDGPEIDCLTLREGPLGIESQRHVDQVADPVCRLIEGEDNRADAFVIACFSDPGLHAARETTRRPVFGISESSILRALSLGERFGIIAILPSSVNRHQRYIRQMGLQERFAADLPLGVSVSELADADAIGDRMSATGKRLREEHGADVIIMGCAGMAHYRDRLEQELDCPVIDPTQAATADALAAMRLGWRTQSNNR